MKDQYVIKAASENSVWRSIQFIIIAILAYLLLGMGSVWGQTVNGGSVCEGGVLSISVSSGPFATYALYRIDPDQSGNPSNNLVSYGLGTGVIFDNQTTPGFYEIWKMDAVFPAPTDPLSGTNPQLLANRSIYPTPSNVIITFGGTNNIDYTIDGTSYVYCKDSGKLQITETESIPAFILEKDPNWKVSYTIDEETKLSDGEGGSLLWEELAAGEYTLNASRAGCAESNLGSMTVTEGTITNVNKGLCYINIQKAITDATEGDEIVLGPGIYEQGAISLNKALTIKGPNAGIPGIDSGRNPEAQIKNSKITITAAATIDGVEIYQTNNTADAILLQAAATIKNSIIRRDGESTGIVARGITTAVGTSGFQVEGNLFTGDLSGNLFSGHKTWNSGLWLNGGSGTVSGNTFENCRTAINAEDFNGGITISGNTIKNSGTFIAFGGTTPTSGQFILGANNFDNLVSTFINLSNVSNDFRLDITSSTYGGSSFSSLTRDELFGIESTMYHRGQSSRNGLVTYVANNQYVVAQNPSISAAIGMAQEGGIVNVGPGTFTEAVQINKRITLDGSGETTIINSGSGYGIMPNVGGNSKTDRLVIKNLKITGSTYGIHISQVEISHITFKNIVVDGVTSTGLQIQGTGTLPNALDPAIVNDLIIDGCKFNNALTYMGFSIDKYSSVDGLTIRNSEFNNNSRGFYSQRQPNSLHGKTYITNVLIENTKFNNNRERAIYLEKLDNAVFDGIEVIGNGYASDMWNTGLELNLKFDDYSDITIANSTITNNGLGNTQNYGTGLNIKARDDGSYASNPASLTNLTILNNNITGNQRGIGIGEFGKTSSSVSNVTIQNNVIKDNLVYNLINELSTLITATCNWWGTTDFNVIAPKVEGNVDISTFLTSDDILNPVCDGEALLVYNEDKTTYYETIAEAISAAEENDVITIGTATFSGPIVINKPLTLQAGSTPVIDGGGNGTVITITSNNVTLDGISVIGSGNNPMEDAGIKLVNVTGCTIKNSFVEGNNAPGIALVLSNNNQILNNSITDNTLAGIALMGSSSNTVTGNTVTGTKKVEGRSWGIVLNGIDTNSDSRDDVFSTSNTIATNPLISGNLNGVYFGWDCNENTLTDNNIENNGADGFVAWKSHNHTIIGNNINNNAGPGIQLHASQNNTITGNTITGNNTANNPGQGGILIRSGHVEYAYPTVLLSTGNAINNNNITGNNNLEIIYEQNAYGDDDDILIEATCNWLGSVDYNQVLGKVSANIDVTTFLLSDNIETPDCSESKWVYNATKNLYYATIQLAINEASVGDEIIVAAGTYTEQILLNKALTLKGANAGVAAGANPGTRAQETIINGGFIVSQAATIDGFNIKNGRSSGSFKVGVAVASSDVIIKNSIIEDVLTPAQSDGVSTQPGNNNLTLTNSTIRNNWRGIYLNPGSGHIFSGNLIDANNGIGVGIGSDGQSNLTLTGNIISNHTLEGWGASAVGDNVMANDNQFIDNEIPIAHYGGQPIDATENWFDCDTYAEIFSLIQGPVNFVPFYLDEEGSKTGGGPTEIANLVVTYTPNNKDIFVSFDVTEGDMELLPAPGLNSEAQVIAAYTALGTAIELNDPDAIQAAALAIGDDVIIDYYYYMGGVKTNLKTIDNKPLVKIKYWDNYLVREDDVRFPNWAPGEMRTSILQGKNYRTHTNPGTGSVADNWLEPALGHDVYVTVTLIQNGVLSSATEVVPIPAGPVNVYSADPSVPANLVSSHYTIQSAIDTADNGYYIVLDEGVFTEDATTASFNLGTKQGLKFIGATDSEGNPTSILHGSLYLNDNDAGKVENIKFVYNTTLSLLTLQNTNGLEIKNCVFVGDKFITSSIVGIKHVSGPNGNSAILVDDCKFIDGLHVSIDSRFGSSPAYSHLFGLHVKNSIFDNVKSGINQQSANDVIVENSTFNLSGISSYGVRFASATDIANNLSITGSVFTIAPEYTSSYAIHLRAAAGGTIQALHNSFGFELLNESTALLDASCNWWGTTVASEIADMFSGNVDYVEWLVPDMDGEIEPWWSEDAYTCSGTPVVILSAVPTAEICKVDGSILVTWEGGSADYTVSWSGTENGSEDKIEDAYFTITGLDAGTYDITVTDANGSFDVINGVSVGYLPVTNITQITYHPTIQAAINAANDNDVIEVCAGEYNETILVDKGITLLGPNYNISPNSGTRVDEAVITGNLGSISAAIRIGASDVIIKGFKITGITGTNGARSAIGGGHNFVDYTQPNNVTIEKMLIVDNQAYGIYTNGHLIMNNWKIHDNKITGLTGGNWTAIQAWKQTNQTITNNTIDNIGYGGINVSDVNIALIDGNSISNVPKQGLQIAFNTGYTTSNITVTNNTITNANTASDADRGAIRLYGGSQITGYVTIKNNVLTNSFNGIAVKNGDVIPENVYAVTNNLIADNSNKAIYHGGTGTLNATCNWFGTGVCPPNAVSGNVNIYPYLTDGTNEQVGELPGFVPKENICLGIEVIANAGASEIICNAASYGLQAVLSGIGSTGLWEKISGPGTAQFDDDTDPKATVTVNVAGKYTLRWTESFGSCKDFDYADIELTFLKGTLADATAMNDIPDIQTIVKTPVILYSTTQYGNLVGTDPDIQVNALVTTSLVGGFPVGAEIIEVRYRQTSQPSFVSVPVANSTLAGKSSVLLSDVIGMENPLVGHNGLFVEWEIVIAGADEAVTVPVTFQTISYYGAFDLDGCFAVLAEDNFTMTYADVEMTYPVLVEECSQNEIVITWTETYPLVQNNGGSRVLNESKWEFFADQAMTTPATLPSGTKITVGAPDGVGGLAWSRTSQLNVATSYFYGSAIITEQQDPTSFTNGDLRLLERASATNNWIAIIEDAPVGTYYVKVSNLALVDLDGTNYNPNTPGAISQGPHGTFVEYPYDIKEFTVEYHAQPMVSFAFNGVEAGHNVRFEYCYDTQIGVTLHAIYTGEAPFKVTYTINDGTPVTVSNLGIGSTIVDSQTYAPGTYNVVVTDITDANGCKASQEFLNLCTAEVTVFNELVAGAAGNNQTICANTAPLVELIAASPSGGSGTFAYQWQVLNVESWDNIAGANYLNYQPPVLDATTTYRLMQTDTYCNPDQFVYTNEVTITVNPLPTPSITGPITVTAGSTEIYSTQKVTGNTYAWEVNGTPIPSTGAIIPFTGGTAVVNEDAALIEINWDVNASGSYPVKVTEKITASGCEDVSTLEVTVNAIGLKGTISYYKASSANPPMNNVTVKLLNVDAETVTEKASTITSPTGYYEFAVMPAGVTHIEVSTVKPWGGANSTDALAIQRRAVNLFPSFWTPVPFIDKVGDVVPGTLNATDALQIRRRAIQLITSFAAGDWAFYNATNGANFNNVAANAARLPLPAGNQLDIWAMAYGDVNGSFSPSAAKSVYALQVDGVKYVQPGQEFELPLKLAHNMEFSALTLFLEYAGDLIDVTGIESTLNGFEYNIQNGNLSMAWTQIEPVNMGSGEALFTMKLRTKADVTKDQLVFWLGNDTEFADENAEVINDWTLIISSIDNTESSVGTDNLPVPGYNLNSYPNPFRDELQISYSIAQPGNVRIMVMNSTGAIVAEIANHHHNAGDYARTFKPEESSLQPGIYFVRMEATDHGQAINKLVRVIYMK